MTRTRRVAIKTYGLDVEVYLHTYVDVTNGTPGPQCTTWKPKEVYIRNTSGDLEAMFSYDGEDSDVPWISEYPDKYSLLDASGQPVFLN